MSQPAIYLLNNDLTSGAVDSEHEWIRRGIAVTSGEKRDKLERPELGHLIALHVSGIGIVALGVATGTSVREVREDLVNADEPWEFHRDVNWVYDLRHQPISTSTLSTWKVSRTATGSYMQGDRPAKVLEWIASQQPLLKTERIEYEQAAQIIVNMGPMRRPAGNLEPRWPSGSSSSQFVRDPAVRAWTLKRSGYLCECCDKPAPFKTPRAGLYLESHHLSWLADGGPDTPENTVAVCPNCHRELHYGENSKLRTAELRVKVLARESELGATAEL